jgi:hypothetical protein
MRTYIHDVAVAIITLVGILIVAYLTFHRLPVPLEITALVSASTAYWFGTTVWRAFRNGRQDNP